MDVAWFRVLLAVLVGWLTDEQRAVIAYLVEENRTLRAQLGGQRLRFTDDQRRRLVVRGCAGARCGGARVRLRLVVWGLLETAGRRV